MTENIIVGIVSIGLLVYSVLDADPSGTLLRSVHS